MAAKLNPNVLYVQEPREPLSPQDSDRLAQAEAADESSDSDGEQEETSHKLIRKVSTSGQIRAKVALSSEQESIPGRRSTQMQLWIAWVVAGLPGSGGSSAPLRCPRAEPTRAWQGPPVSSAVGARGKAPRTSREEDNGGKQRNHVRREETQRRG
ncbi:hypothetical protein AAFF_G00377570 [Aldrovandia affinis]|uniref:Uncharacterized protein n=1 Tax=Aldrovandia affinis TaxID=143900 RepID=A0AAD7WLU0_9TELE|nr:hypothetical protein AAFF_G00377570 [Aldrovandia affinis]